MGTEKQWSFVMAERLKQLREAKGLSHERLSSALSAQYGISISSDSLMNYEVTGEFHSKKYKNLGMRVEYLRYFSDFYNVSTDYLLGLTDTQSTNEDVQAVCQVTGLREDNIYDLMGLTDPVEAPYLREMVNEFLSYAVDDCALVTYKAFRKYIDMDNQRWWDLNNLSKEEYEQKSEQMRQFVAAAEENGYLIMSYGAAAEKEWKKLQEDYGKFLLSRYRRFDKHGNPRKREEDTDGID